jgi:predicted Zn-dependent protease
MRRTDSHIARRGTGAVAGVLAATALLAGCAGPLTGPVSTPAPAPRTQQPAARAVDPAQLERLKRVMVPLLRSANTPRQPGEVRIGIVDDPHVNAGSAGKGKFLITTGLLAKASDQQLAGVLAHEVAHDDLGHVAKAQTLGAGLAVGMVILDQVFPGSSSLTPVAASLIQRAYGRQEEYAADRHGRQILQRAGYPADVMVNTLIWLAQTEGSDRGGFFATHPATGDRIDALRSQAR